MPSQWGRQPMGKDSWTLVLWIVIIGIIGYLVIPVFFKSINSDNQTADVTSLSSIDSLNTNNSDALNSSSFSSQLFPSTNTIPNNGSGNNVIASGYWVLYVLNGTSQQLSLSDNDYTFLETLIQSDSNGNGTTTVFLVDNGQIHQYRVSNETYSIITNMANIRARASSNSNLSAAGQSATTSETLTVSSPSTTGFTVALNPALNGLTLSNFTLTNSSGNSISLSEVKTLDNGATYTIYATLSPGQSYTITAKCTGYTFGTPQNVIIPSAAVSGTVSETLTVSNPSTSGFTAALNPALYGLTISNFTLVNSSGNSITITDVKTLDNGATYAISANLSSGQTYALTAADTGYTFGAAQNVVVP